MKKRTAKIYKRKDNRDARRWNEIDYGALESRYKRQYWRGAINEKEQIHDLNSEVTYG